MSTTPILPVKNDPEPGLPPLPESLPLAAFHHNANEGHQGTMSIWRVNESGQMKIKPSPKLMTVWMKPTGLYGDTDSH